LTDIFGTSGVTLIEGAVDPLLGIGVSLTDMLGMGWALPLDPRLGADDSLTDIDGMSGVMDLEAEDDPRPKDGELLTDILGTGAVTLDEGLW
jgi:hypothetical protein